VSEYLPGLADFDIGAMTERAVAVLGGHPRDCGYAWSDLRSAAEWVATQEVRP